MAETKTQTLTDFLLARIAEQRLECDGAVEYSGCWDLSEFVEHAVDAMRRIVEESEGRYGSAADQAWVTLSILAAVYAEHPDFREEWKP